MKILFLSWAYPKLNTPYLGIWAHQQALALSEKGIEVEVVNMVPYVPQLAGLLSNKIKKYVEIPTHELYGGILVHHPRFFRTKPGSIFDQILFRFFWFQCTRISASLGKKLDLSSYSILHAHNLFPDGAIAYLLNQKYAIPYILTLHDVDKFNSCPEEGKHKDITMQIIQNAQKVLVVSKRVKNNILPHIKTNNLQLLYNTFWTYGNIKTPSMVRKKKIVTIASLIKRKGVHILLRAFKRVQASYPDYELVVIGSGKQLEPLIDLSKDLDIEANVTFTGALDHIAAMSWLAQASIFCLPSWDEAFGVVYAEAMSYGIPIIGCFGEGIEDIVTDRVNGMLVKPESVEDLEQALLFLIENQDQAKLIGQSGNESINDLNPDIFGDKLIKIYHEVMTGT